VAEISKTADQALTVLLEVGRNGPLTPAELARTLGMNRTVVHRLLSTLHQRGFVTRQEGGYVPGAILVRIADRVQPELRAMGRVAMQELARATGETAVMHTADGVDAVVLEQVVPDGNLVRVEHEIGSRHPLHEGASGRALLAFLDAASVQRIADHVGDDDGLQRQLQTVRQLGYALSHDELQLGVHGLAVPVHDTDDHAVASMALLAPTTRATNLPTHLDALRQASANLSRTLYGRR
jgi:IclR family transcriptional regulator, KDG regulon repressor